MPVPWTDYADVNPGEEFEADIVPLNISVTGTIIRISDYIDYVGGSQVFYAVGKISTNSAEEIPLNIITQCEIKGKPKTAFQYIKEFFIVLLS
jgi:hypothetical protein